MSKAEFITRPSGTLSVVLIHTPCGERVRNFVARAATLADLGKAAKDHKCGRRLEDVRREIEAKMVARRTHQRRIVALELELGALRRAEARLEYFPGGES